MNLTIGAVAHSSFIIERKYPVPPARVFAAFADPAQKHRWFGVGPGRTVEQFTMDFRIGGSDVTRSRLPEGTPFPGVEMVNHTTYLDIVPDSRIVFAYSMTIGGRCISASLATVELLEAGLGTDMIFTEQSAFFEGADGPAMRETGWRTLLASLAEELSR
jgi:uncharacterized protein YndB with AHSA1/START domain